MYRQSDIRSKSESYFRLLDYWLLIPVLLITLIGLYVLNQVYQLGYGAGSYPGNIIKQLGAVMMGILLAIGLSFIDLTALKLVGYLTYAGGIFFLIVVHIDGFSMASLTGADSWIRFPIFGTFQPSELAKVGIALVLADILAQIKKSEISLGKGILSGLLVCGIPLFLISREPDFGTFFVICLMVITMIFICGISWAYIIAGILAGIIGIPLAWNFYLDAYQKNRIMTFLFPGHDANSDYHIEQALRAVSSGGFAGKSGTGDIPVPVKESDFIFSAISEYLGFIGTTILIILIIIFIARSIYIAYHMAEYSLAGSYLMIGLIAVQGFHFVENIGMNVGVLPITGIPLPYVSSGGSSMVVSYFMLGLMLNVSINYHLFKSSEL